MPDFKVDAKINALLSGTPLVTGVSLSPGQVLAINVDPCSMWSAGSPDRTSNANGLGRPFGRDFGLIPHSDFPFGALIASLNEGKSYFPVGTQMVRTIMSPGKLWLAYADTDAYNNSGSVIAKVTVSPPVDVSHCAVRA